MLLFGVLVVQSTMLKVACSEHNCHGFNDRTYPLAVSGVPQLDEMLPCLRPGWYRCRYPSRPVAAVHQLVAMGGDPANRSLAGGESHVAVRVGDFPRPRLRFDGKCKAATLACRGTLPCETKCFLDLIF
jgi:hypothetical protein